MTTEPSNHDALREQAAAYALGGLSEAERSAFEAHLNGCAECKAEVGAFLPVSGALAQAVEQHDPPAALRGRILGAARRAPAAPRRFSALAPWRSEEHTSELQSLAYLVCRLLLEKKKKKINIFFAIKKKTIKIK